MKENLAERFSRNLPEIDPDKLYIYIEVNGEHKWSHMYLKGSDNCAGFQDIIYSSSIQMIDSNGDTLID